MSKDSKSELQLFSETLATMYLGFIERGLSEEQALAMCGMFVDKFMNEAARTRVVVEMPPIPFGKKQEIN
jgi:hypothetical protein